jgi:hypothetical protein
MVMMKVMEILSKMCGDDELDDSGPGPAPHMFNNSDATCMFCGEIGRDEELWFRRALCLSWVHAECSAAETSNNFVSDF